VEHPFSIYVKGGEFSYKAGVVDMGSIRELNKGYHQ
jgi:hypothetical protein